MKKRPSGFDVSAPPRWEQELSSRLADAEFHLTDSELDTMWATVSAGLPAGPSRRSGRREGRFGFLTAVLVLLLYLPVNPYSPQTLFPLKGAEDHSETRLTKSTPQSALNTVFGREEERKKIDIDIYPKVKVSAKSGFPIPKSTERRLPIPKIDSSKVKNPPNPISDSLTSVPPIAFQELLFRPKPQKVGTDLPIITEADTEIPASAIWYENTELIKKTSNRWSWGGLVGTSSFRENLNTNRDVSFNSLSSGFDNQGNLSLRKTRDTVSIPEETDLSTVWSYQAGVMAGYQFAEKWTLQTGLQYTYQKTTRSGEYVLRDIEKGEVLSPTTIPYSDTSAYTLERYNTSMPQNLHYIGVPLRVSCRLGKGNLGFAPSAGLLLNYLVYAPVPNSLQQQTFTFPTIYNPWHLSGTVGFGLEYRLSSEYAFNLEPQFRFSVTSITRRSVETQYPHSVGLALTFVKTL